MAQWGGGPVVEFWVLPGPALPELGPGEREGGGGHVAHQLGAPAKSLLRWLWVHMAHLSTRRRLPGVTQCPLLPAEPSGPGSRWGDDVWWPWEDRSQWVVLRAGTRHPARTSRRRGPAHRPICEEVSDSLPCRKGLHRVDSWLPETGEVLLKGNSVIFFKEKSGSKGGRRLVGEVVIAKEARPGGARSAALGQHQHTALALQGPPGISARPGGGK